MFAQSIVMKESGWGDSKDTLLRLISPPPPIFMVGHDKCKLINVCLAHRSDLIDITHHVSCVLCSDMPLCNSLHLSLQAK